jgi:hypothetical protein
MAFQANQSHRPVPAPAGEATQLGLRARSLRNVPKEINHLGGGRKEINQPGGGGWIFRSNSNHVHFEVRANLRLC